MRVFLSLCLSVSLSVCVSLSVTVSLCLSVTLSLSLMANEVEHLFRYLTVHIIFGGVSVLFPVVNLAFLLLLCFESSFCILDTNPLLDM